MRLPLGILFVAFVCAANNSNAQSYLLATQQMGKAALPEYFIDQAKAGMQISLPTMIPGPNSEVGHVGVFRPSAGLLTMRCMVLQQVDEGTLALIEVQRPMSRTRRGNPAVERGSQADALSNFARKYGGPKDTRSLGPFLLASDRYRDLSDDTVFQPLGTWEITGTFQYLNALGSRKTIWKLEPAMMDDIDVPVDPRLVLIPPRKWSLQNGSDLTASYLKQEDGKIHLLSEDGEEQQVTLQDISDADRHYVRQTIIDQKYPPELRSPARQWSDRSGKFRVHASFLDYDQGTVKLLREDATEVDVRLRELSSEDQRYIRKKVLESQQDEKPDEE